MKKISTIIPNYNGRELLEKNLPEILAAVKDTEIIIVDDGSLDGSVEYLKKNFPKIKIIKNKKNQGFVFSANRGIKTAKGEIVILLNTDIRPERNFLAAILSNFKEDTFAIASLQQIREGKRKFFGGAPKGLFRYGFLKHLNQKGPYPKVFPIFYANGGASAFSRQKLLELGGFDEIYSPYYWEDADLSWQAQKRGWKVLGASQSRVFHEHESTIQKQGKRVRKVASRNFFIFNWKNLSNLDLILKHLFWLPINLTRELFRGNFVYWAGFFMALGKLPQIIRIRKNNRKYYQVPDKEILKKWQNQS